MRLKKCIILIGFNLLLLPQLASQAQASDASCLAMGCHEGVKKFQILHGPVKANGCTVCHRPGASDLVLPKKHPQLLPLLKSEINALCTTCHEDKSDRGHKFLHKVTQEKSCIACHEPHGAQDCHAKSLLKLNPTFDLCLSCHTELKDKVHLSHGQVLTDKKGCLNCHESHFSEHKKLLKAPAGQLCLDCHQNSLSKKDGSKIDRVEKLPPLNGSSHKPVFEGECQACHDPHGSVKTAFLKHEYTNDDFALCMSCHKSALASEPETLDATGFRNGKKNLHHLHLNNRIKIEGCRTCHEVHSSTQQQLIRTQMNFGGTEWKLPLRFTRTAEGGTCATACHGEKSYDRFKPITNKAGR